MSSNTNAISKMRRGSIMENLRQQKSSKQHSVQYTEDGKVNRKSTKLEQQMLDKLDDAITLLEDVPEIEYNIEQVDIPKMAIFVPQMIQQATFCGHIVTDLDSVAGAISAATLYGGIPAIASEINSETEYALKRFNIPTPRRIEDIVAEDPETKICLVDHQQTSQMNSSIQAKNVVGIIDHHALQNKTVITEKPVFVDIRPWGSMSTIIGHSFLTQKKRPSKGVAGILLCAILSDTLNLQSPTTTDWDRVLVTALAEIAEIDDIDDLAVEQFQAKSKELKNLSAYSLVNGDQKTFSFNEKNGFKGELGFAVIETTDDEVILERVDELVIEMVAAKKENSIDLLFLSIVNIVELRSQLVLCGPGEISLAKKAYGGKLSEDLTLMNLGDRVSRKKEFIPALASSIQQGWNRKKDMGRGLSDINPEDLGQLEVSQVDPYGQVRRFGSVLMKRAPSEFLFLDE